MAFKATYVDASTFTVSEDRTEEFVAGRAILADCGDDGEFDSHVSSSSYDSGANETTVNIYDSVLTFNLSDVWYGAIYYAIPLHDHSSRSKGGAAVVQEHGNEKHTSIFVAEAPKDGIQYARKDGGWAQVQAMQEHDNTWHSKDFVTSALVEDIASKVAYQMLPTRSTFAGGDIVSFTTGSTFKSGSIESFTTTSS